MSAEGRVKFNVGGTLFETTRSCLNALGSEYLDKLLDSDSGFKQPADGIYFIDRNPDCFRALLNVARYGQAHIGGNVTMEMMEKEADFYAVNDWCRDHLKPRGNREERVKFNVGGTFFETTRGSLKPLGSKYLETLLNGRQPADGIYFIDRDPDCFRTLLTVARYGQAYEGDEISKEMMKDEADFYMVNDWIRIHKLKVPF